jgi:hypothetical protein
VLTSPLELVTLLPAGRPAALTVALLCVMLRVGAGRPNHAKQQKEKKITKQNKAYLTNHLYVLMQLCRIS